MIRLNILLLYDVYVYFNVLYLKEYYYMFNLRSFDIVFRIPFIMFCEMSIHHFDISITTIYDTWLYHMYVTCLANIFVVQFIP